MSELLNLVLQIRCLLICLFELLSKRLELSVQLLDLLFICRVSSTGSANHSSGVSRCGNGHALHCACVSCVGLELEAEGLLILARKIVFSGHGCL